MSRKRQKLFTIAALTTFMLVLPALPLLAKRIAVDQVQISTPAYAPADSFNPLMGRYSYAVSWNGIPAGSVELEINRDDDGYEVRASAQTAKGIDLLYKLRYNSTAFLSADTLKPKHSFSVVRTNSKKDTMEIEFFPGGEILSTRKNHRGKIKTIKFDPENFTLDPYSAGFLALSQEWKVGEHRRFDMFSGKDRYLIEFSAIEQTELTINEEPRLAIVLVPTITKLSGRDDDKKENKLRQARIYISPGQSREILKISSSLLFGTVNTEMTGFTPTPKPAPPAADQGKIATMDMKNSPAYWVITDDFPVPLSPVSP